MKFKKALLIVDIQNDFCPGGSLAVPDGDKIIPSLNKYIRLFSQNKFPIFVSRDWHPKRTKHFKNFGGLWPRHCVQNTRGAKFHPDLRLPKEAIIISKGTDPGQDSYSAFQAQDKKGTSFLQLLKKLRIGELFIGGLATDYCVKQSVLDARKFGFKVKLLVDAIKGVNIKTDNSRKAIEKMAKRGAKLWRIKKSDKNFL